ncbi:MAG: hypothetical protein ACK4TI_03515 [Nitrososphaerales archaeon]
MSEEAVIEEIVQRGEPVNVKQTTPPLETTEVQTAATEEGEERAAAVEELGKHIEGSLEGHPQWGFGETLKAEVKRKAKASEESQKIFSTRLDLPTLYGYVAALEQRVEALERLIDALTRVNR